MTTVEGALVDLLSFGLVRPKAIYGESSPSSSIDPTRAVRFATQRLCQELIPDAIGLTDAFGFTDWDLDRLVIYSLLLAHFPNNNVVFFSALGVYNGKVYEALWERAQTEPLNRTQVPVAYEVSSRNIYISSPKFMICFFFQASIKPILQRGQRLAAVGSTGAKL